MSYGRIDLLSGCRRLGSVVERDGGSRTGNNRRLAVSNGVDGAAFEVAGLRSVSLEVEPTLMILVRAGQVKRVDSRLALRIKP